MKYAYHRNLSVEYSGYGYVSVTCAGSKLEGNTMNKKLGSPSGLRFVLTLIPSKRVIYITNNTIGSVAVEAFEKRKEIVYARNCWPFVGLIPQGRNKIFRRIFIGEASAVGIDNARDLSCLFRSLCRKTQGTANFYNIIVFFSSFMEFIFTKGIWRCLDMANADSVRGQG